MLCSQEIEDCSTASGLALEFFCESYGIPCNTSILGGIDYEAANFTITFTSTDSNIKCSNITIFSDDEIDPIKTFSLLFDSQDPRIQLGAITNLTVTIIGMSTVWDCINQCFIWLIVHIDIGIGIFPLSPLYRGSYISRK